MKTMMDNKQLFHLPLYCFFLIFLLLKPAWAAAPNPPSGLTATPLSSSKIQLAWADNSTDETYFYIERKIGASGTYSNIGSVGANITTYTHINLTQNTEYYYRVRAYNTSGYSAYSNEANTTTPSCVQEGTYQP